VNEGEARELLRAERARVEGLLEDAVRSGLDDRSTASEPGNRTDSAEPLTSELTDDAVAAGLRDRLEAIGRAERRLEERTFGRSVRSGAPIPDDRLRADPAAELTVEEASRGV
jgi:DnaK suppressor protein